MMDKIINIQKLIILHPKEIEMYNYYKAIIDIE